MRKQTAESKDNNAKSASSTSRLIRFFQIMIVLIIIAMAVLFLFNRDKFTISKITEYSPDNKVLAAGFIVIAFMLKSLSIFFPIVILYLATGFIFDWPIAIIINILGAFAGLVLPYLIGRFSGSGFVENYLEKHPKAKKMVLSQKKNDVFLAYVLRVAGIFPYDLVSMYLGSVRMPFGKYILGSMLGVTPWLIAITLIGENIRDPKSIEFILSTVFGVLVSIISILLYRKVAKTSEKL